MGLGFSKGGLKVYFLIGLPTRGGDGKLQVFTKKTLFKKFAILPNFRGGIGGFPGMGGFGHLLIFGAPPRGFYFFFWAKVFLGGGPPQKTIGQSLCKGKFQGEFFSFEF